MDIRAGCLELNYFLGGKTSWYVFSSFPKKSLNLTSNFINQNLRYGRISSNNESGCTFLFSSHPNSVLSVIELRSLFLAASHVHQPTFWCTLFDKNLIHPLSITSLFARDPMHALRGSGWDVLIHDRICLINSSVSASSCSSSCFRVRCV